MPFSESEVELAAIGWLTGLGYTYAFAPDLACDGASPERSSYSEVLLPSACCSPLPSQPRYPPCCP